MTSFRISVTPSRRAAGRFINRARRVIQKTFAEENKISGLTQSKIARAIGVHRSVINREMRGQKDITLGRIAELAWAMGREPVIEFQVKSARKGQNFFQHSNPMAVKNTATTMATSVSNTAQPVVNRSSV